MHLASHTDPLYRAEGPAIHPAKGGALVYRSHRVLYSVVSCGLRPNGPRDRLNWRMVRVGLKMNSWPVGPNVTGNKKRFWCGRYTRASPFAGRRDAPSGLTSTATSAEQKQVK